MIWWIAYFFGAMIAAYLIMVFWTLPEIQDNYAEEDTAWFLTGMAVLLWPVLLVAAPFVLLALGIKQAAQYTRDRMLARD